MSGVGSREPAVAHREPAAPGDLLHRLNNQLGVILAHAELIEQKAPSDEARARASQVVQAALHAMAVSRELRDVLDSSTGHPPSQEAPPSLPAKLQN